VGFSIANIVSPQMFQAKDAPGYLPAKIAIVIANAAAIVVASVLRVLYGRRNAKVDRCGGSAGAELEERFMKDDKGKVSGDGFQYVY
jgi:hypothetical protein